MKYVDMSSLEKYMGEAAFAAWQQAHANAERALEHCEKRMLRRIIPNTPRSREQIAAFCEAVYAQIIHESANNQLAGMPDNMRSFSLNGFSATLNGSMGDSASTIGLCREARAILHLAGLDSREVSI